MSTVAAAIDRGEIGGRLWFYANYHCNLRCTYCLTESAPQVTRRELGREQIVERAREAGELGFMPFPERPPGESPAQQTGARSRGQAEVATSPPSYSTSERSSPAR